MVNIEQQLVQVKEWNIDTQQDWDTVSLTNTPFWQLLSKKKALQMICFKGKCWKTEN